VIALAEFENLLRTSIGLDVASIGTSSVERAIRERQRACGLGDVDAYWDLLRESETELEELIDLIVVPETWFFRDRQAFDMLARVAREEWLPARPSGLLQMLSLPSSTGEEPYSMAMALLDAGVPAHRFRIDAIDVSARALAVASRGVYGKNSFRGTDLGYREQHFDETDTGYQLHENVRRQVLVHRGNICTEDLLPGSAIYDAIFCRNLLIYLNRETQERAIRVFERLLTPAGLLFVAPSETSLMLSRPAEWIKETRAFGFRRGAGTQPRQTPRRVTPLSTPRAPVPAGPRRRTRPTSADPTATSRPGLAEQTRQSPEERTRQMAEPAAALDQATRLANLGRFGEAAACCQEHLTRHGPSAEVFHLLGVLRDATGDPAEAVTYYRKALYLEPHNQEVLIHLALVLEKLGKTAEAQVLRHRERRIAGKEKDEVAR
jgi:chemotaxis protein methyltransferase WspC